MSTVRLALAQYPIDALSSPEAYQAKLTAWVQTAANNGASILVFPEYGSMELTSLLSDAQRKDLVGSVKSMMLFWDSYNAIHQELTKRFNVHILAASFPKDGENIASLFAPNGKIGRQPKSIMTRFEREEWYIKGNPTQYVFNTIHGMIGIAICYDAEFPLLVRRQVEAGAKLILVPSCTDTLAGYHRVKISAQARALENQCYVAQSVTVGDAPWSPATDVNIGAAGVFGPPDVGFPDNGILVEGELNKPSWIYADISLSKVDSIRRHGRVLNHTHWDEQADAQRQGVTIMDLL